MALRQGLSVLLGFCVLGLASSVHGTARLELVCPVVEEGNSVTLLCLVTMDDGLRPWLFWYERDRNKMRQITSCHGNECDHRAALLQPDDRIPGMFRSELTVTRRHTTNEHRGDEYTCTVLSYGDSSLNTSITDDGNSKTRKSCALETYLLPKQPRCSISSETGLSGLIPNTNVKIQCGPERVYPGMKCTLKQKWTFGDYSEVKAVDVTFVHSNSNGRLGHEDRNTSCAASLLLREPGNYRFSVEMQPILVTQRLLAATMFPSTGFDESPVIPIPVTEPTLRIVTEPPTTKSFCKEEDQPTYVCYEMGFTSPITFRWYINGVPAPRDSIKNSSNRSKLFLAATEIPLDGAEIKCIVTGGGNSANSSVRHTVRRPSPPTPRLEFAYVTSENVGSSLFLQGGSLTSLQCRHSNLNATVTSLYVQCLRDQSVIVQEEITVTSIPVDRNLRFSLVGSSKANTRTVCTCRAKSNELCFKERAVLSIHNDASLIINPYDTVETEAIDPSSSTDIAPTVLLALILALVVVVLIVVAVIYYRKKILSHIGYGSEPAAENNGNEGIIQASRQYENMPGPVVAQETSSRDGEHLHHQIQIEQRIYENEIAAVSPGHQETTTRIEINASRDIYDIDQDVYNPQPSLSVGTGGDDVSINRASSMRSERSLPVVNGASENSAQNSPRNGTRGPKRIYSERICVVETVMASDVIHCGDTAVDHQTEVKQVATSKKNVVARFRRPVSGIQEEADEGDEETKLLSATPTDTWEDKRRDQKIAPSHKKKSWENAPRRSGRFSKSEKKQNVDESVQTQTSPKTLAPQPCADSHPTRLAAERTERQDAIRSERLQTVQPIPYDETDGGCEISHSGVGHTKEPNPISYDEADGIFSQSGVGHTIEQSPLDRTDGALEIKAHKMEESEKSAAQGESVACPNVGSTEPQLGTGTDGGGGESEGCSNVGSTEPQLETRADGGGGESEAGEAANESSNLLVPGEHIAGTDETAGRQSSLLRTKKGGHE